MTMNTSAQTENKNMEQNKTFSLLALGDSYTIGESVPENERFPVQAAEMLKNKKISIDPIKIIATTGWTTDELKNAIDVENIAGTYDVVTLLIGVNNQYRGRDAENYRVEFKDLLHMAIAFARQKADHVIVLSIPDWGVTPFANGKDAVQIAAEIDLYNSINKTEALKAGAKYIDITPITRESPGDPALLAGDGLHPSGKMYGRWAELVSEMIAKF